MDYRIALNARWRYRHPKHGRSELSPGTYDVPEQIPDAVAQKALAEGVARRIDPPKAPIKPSQLVPLSPGYRKKPAPRNKARGPAPENKSALV